ncbi:MAG: APC family permease [Armatimonadetes bacterium]|nr:APC family permease [Armatimonadota bacterium]
MQNIAHEKTTVMRHTVEPLPVPRWRRWLVGEVLSTADAGHQTIGKLVGLAVFSSDALSSSAYATQEILIILAAVGSSAFHYAIPISLAICALLLIVTLSYEQTIHAYPGGGGAYIVARDNLGERAAQTAGAALLTDYVLTVAVSISSGVAQITSAYPQLYPYRVLLAVGTVVLIMTINLRGVKESGTIFALPTYFFIAMMYTTVIYALSRYAMGSLGSVQAMGLHVEPFQPKHMLTAVTPFLLLHAFSSGTAALTGVEAISNGITAFREPRSRNAGITLLWMSGILGTLFLMISFLSVKIGAIPSEAVTVISQLAEVTFHGRNLLYFGTIWATTVILLMGANTAFADFPRLAALQAADGYLPRQMTLKGSRLVFSWGIVILAVVASLLIIAFGASVNGLIPLYAIGVFLSFTLSQAGMARRWHRCGRLGPEEEVVEPGSTLRFDAKWRPKMVINGVGSVATFVVMLVFAWTKFSDGAWFVLLLVPTLIGCFMAIHAHYKDLGSQLSLNGYHSAPRLNRNRVILMVSGVHRGSLAALRYARLLSHDVTAVHVSSDPAEEELMRDRWDVYGEGVRLVVLHSPYRALLAPLVRYVDNLAANALPNEVITVIVPQFVPKRWWHHLLHMQTATWLRLALLSRPGVQITDVPYQLR